MFISCGDALIDVFNQPTDIVGKVAMHGHVGGSPLNVAVGLARLGNEAGFLCKNSSDFMGQQIAAYMKLNGVRDDWMLETSLNSTLAMIQTNADGSANYSFYTDNTADVSLRTNELPDKMPDSLDALHFSSYSTAVGSTRRALLALAKREAGNCVISYDPNLRTSIEPDTSIWRDTFAQLSPLANYVKASDEDISMLFGDGKSFESFAVDTIGAGASLVAVTEGADGCTLYTEDGRRARSKPIKVTVADTVGAGDTFQAASLHWLKAHGCISNGTLNLADADIEACVNFAAVAAAITCTRHGADLPTLQEVEAGLN